MDFLRKYNDQPDDINVLSKTIVDCLFKVHSALGPGYLEKIYEDCFCIEAEKRKLRVFRQHPIVMMYDGKKIPTEFRLDVVVENRVLLEFKAVERLLPVHEAQIYSYMRMSGLRMGFLVNFNVPLIKEGIKRFVPKELRSFGSSLETNER